ncbi:meiotically up-regulated 190 protein [Favolaschia claudopus]|uniref:Meiotically up-regulated 190 protein n=1 Tax=Favolaschia claudopus TaxID=2862362 RepID=A0AAW0BWY6_9AGAR
MSNPPTPRSGTPNSTDSRTVTDPVTHIALAVHDTTSGELEEVPTRQSTPGSEHAPSLDHSQMDAAVNAEARKDWGPDQVRQTKMETASLVAATALGSSLTVFMLTRLLRGTMSGWGGAVLSIGLCCSLGLVAPASVLYFWSPKSPNIQLEGEETQLHKSEPDSPETATWFNAFLHSLWPIVNPSLFISISDMLEDALQASLPKVVYGVRVADIGQGSEAIRILAIRALQAGAATRSSDEEGDFVNLEVALAFRARTDSKSLKERSANPHMLMEFQVTGGILLPVWVELTGLLATTRMRIQLMPNPPFLSKMTFTFLSQPKTTIKCTPLAKSFLNIMDIPGLSGWMQSAIDSAVAMYVAPRSLDLDLKTMLSGRDQMDTTTVGVVFVIIKSAVGCRDGDSGKIWESKTEKHGDPYATVGWGKWAKPMWSSRVIENEGRPVWEEIAVLLVGPPELNAKERLRIQIWDSDRGAADDLLGMIEVDLDEIMDETKSKNKMASRKDSLVDLKGNPCDGELHWEVGYFGKTTLQQHLTERGENYDEIRQTIEHDTERQLREAKSLQHDAQAEIEKQKQADLKDRSDEIIAGSSPIEKWPSGILTVYIEQIRGLMVQNPRGSAVNDQGEEEGSQDLPSAYCTVIINHSRVYKTRTKLKSNKPFFGASTERFIPDWQTASVIIAVRDARTHEIDPLIGVVVLPLKTVFKTRSQINEAFPLVGGIGHGRIQLSLVFRSLQLELPKPMLGWDIATLDIEPHARVVDGNLPADLASCRLTLRTLNSKGKMRSQDGKSGEWRQKNDKPIRLAVKRRFGECLLVQFRKNALGPDHTPAFCTLWLKDLADEEEATVKLPIWRSGHGVLERARVNSEQPSSQDGEEWKNVEQVGTLELTVRVWPGLSGYHKSLASHDANFSAVMQVLDAVEAEGGDASSHDSLYDDEQPSSSESEDGWGKLSRSSTQSNTSEGEKTNGNGEGGGGKGGLVSEMKDYKQKKDELHRNHRGLMQWGAMRKLAWVGHNVEGVVAGAEQKVKSKFKHQQAEQGMEVEA